MKKRLGFMLSIVLMFALVLSACGGGSKNNNAASGTNGAASPEASSEASTEAGAKLKIGMVTDTGGVNDKSFNQSAWDGLQRISKDTGSETKYLESKGDADMEPNLRAFISEKYDMIWGVGFLFQDAMGKVAKDNPDSKFGIIDSAVDAPNVVSVNFAANEGSFLVGVVAGLTTKTNKIGFVGGMEIPSVTVFEAGFNAGVAAVNPEAKVIRNYTGEFNKPDLGKAAAAVMYNDGVDIIFQVAGGTGNGVFNEATARKKAGQDVWVIGVDKDQSIEFGNEVTLTSMLKGVEAAIYQVSNDLINGKWEGGKSVVLGLKDGAVGLPESNPNVSEEIMKKVEDYKQQIISGSLVVPSEVK
ncbi:BMP family ABC transporter substrate-binding protein [Paenibacillus sp. KS-LC4]|uniref:BMP family lipoprotein n=1 Tax=Paenibacillus sp. KS-LC4 TaxID=2979727 RepID=UPI0030CD206E